MKNKVSLKQKINAFKSIYWFNYLWQKLAVGICIASSYYLIKSAVVLITPTVLFNKYEKGFFACLTFYIFLQILKKPPRNKEILKELDHIVGHNRATSYWQFKTLDTPSKELFEADCEQAFEEKLKPCYQYLYLRGLTLITAIALFVGSLVLGSFPSESHKTLEEKLVYKDALTKEIESIERQQEVTENYDEIYDENQIPENPQLTSIKKKLLTDLKASYSQEEALKKINAFEEKYPDLSESTLSNETGHKPSTNQTLENKRNEDSQSSQLLSKVKDAVKNQREQETSSENNSPSSMTESFSELMSQSTDENSGSSNSDTLSIPSETKGATKEGDKNGQGGSGQSYGEKAEAVEEGKLFRDAANKTEALKDTTNETLQISTGLQGESHLTIGHDLEAHETTLDKSIGEEATVITVNTKTINIPSGIPKDRLLLIKAYYEGE